MFPLEVIAQLSRAGSLAIRLFGNIFGEKSVVIELTKLAVGILILDAISVCTGSSPDVVLWTVCWLSASVRFHYLNIHLYSDVY